MPDADKPASAIELFYSYSHKDQDMRDELDKYLSVLRRSNVVAIWHDRKIGAGSEWGKEIDKHLDRADIILLLVSADFLASDYCWGKEMTRAIERHESGQARVIPVILHPCDWEESPIAKLQALPRDARPVSSWPNRAEAFTDTAKGIRAAAKELAQRPAAPQPAKRSPAPSPSAEIATLPQTGAKINPQAGQRYVWIPPGSFEMGCSPGDKECDPDEKPRHRVTISRRFWMGQTPVTVGAYKRFVKATGGEMPPLPHFPQDDEHPVVNVTWEDAVDYCQWAGGRLPTEAEWEYAARSGSTAARYGKLDEIAWHVKNSGGQTHPVGKKTPNGFALYDTLGNVWEWCADWYGENYYKVAEEADPKGPSAGEIRVLRGGSWDNGPRGVRVSNRPRHPPDVRHGLIGFRCVREVIP